MNKYIIVGLGVAAAGLAAFLTHKHIKNKKNIRPIAMNAGTQYYELPAEDEELPIGDILKMSHDLFKAEVVEAGDVTPVDTTSDELLNKCQKGRCVIEIVKNMDMSWEELCDNIENVHNLNLELVKVMKETRPEVGVDYEVLPEEHNNILDLSAACLNQICGKTHAHYKDWLWKLIFKENYDTIVSDDENLDLEDVELAEVLNDGLISLWWDELCEYDPTLRDSENNVYVLSDGVYEHEALILALITIYVVPDDFSKPQ